MNESDMLNHTDEETALRWHVFHNHYPPPPPFMHELARWALTTYRLGHPLDTACPTQYHDRVRNRRGEPLTLSDLLDGLHLWAFLQEEEDYE